MLKVSGVVGLLGHVWSWFKIPDDKPMQLTWREKAVMVIHFLCIDLLIMLPFLGLTHLIHLYLFKLEEPLIDWNPLLVIPLIAVVMPVLEELIFRFPLKYERNYILRGLDFFLKGRIERNWEDYFRWFLYFMIVAFGVVHISNYYNSEVLFYVLSPIIIGSQLLGGILLSFVRVKLGFFWSTLQHIVFNTLLISFGLVFFHGEEIINAKLQDGSLIMRELMFIYEEESYFKMDIRENKIYTLEANDVSLYSVIQSLELSTPYPYDNVWVDIEMESVSGITKDELFDILQKEIRFEKE